MPDGLSFDTATGSISGTPTAISAIAVYTVTAFNSGGNVAFEFSIAIEELLSTNQNQFNNIGIYPNPCVDIINVNGNFENATYRIYSVDGKFIQKDIMSNREIKIEHVPSGLYFLVITEKNTEKTFKILKR